MEDILLVLILLQLKHWYVDFNSQKIVDVEQKRKYGNLSGIIHSLKHGIGTSLCLLIVTGIPYIIYCFILGLIDFVLHYHIDYFRVRKLNVVDNTNYDKNIGLDQLLHQLTYILIAFLMT